MINTHVSVLGVSYKVLIGDMEELELPDNLFGYADLYAKEIKIEHSYREFANRNPEHRLARTKEIIIHELFHAFVHESGLNLDEQLEESLAVWLEKMLPNIIPLVDLLKDLTE